MQKTLIGRYSALKYVIKTRSGVKLYEAGNAMHDSQGYVAEKLGVGLSVMKDFCISTLEEMCQEHNAKNGGVEQMGRLTKLQSSEGIK